MRTVKHLGKVLCLLFIVSPIYADEFENLGKGQRLADFSVEAKYLNAANKAMGARFRHVPSGFVLDVLRIQSVPQGFMWVNTPPPTDQGEPHTLEHLLLGKGTKGRYVASLEDMSLGESSAYTEQTRTCYHYHTSAGTDVFFNLFEKKLDAMINPNFSDEEIRREVCNMGIKVAQDGTLGLEEKGTVYNEMVSSYERIWGEQFFLLGRLLFGENHALSYSAGGYPDDIRTMLPKDIRDFHANTHHLNNMGAAVSIPDDVTLKDCLTRLSAILKRVEPTAKVSQDPATADGRLPSVKPAAEGATHVVNFPSNNADEAGQIVYAWPPDFAEGNNEMYVRQLFLSNLASGETSNLYRTFINSQTRKLDVGASEVWIWIDNSPGFPAYVGLSDVRADAITEKMIDSVRGLITAEISRLAALPDTSSELAAFNERAKNRVIERRRQLRDFLNSPPRWGTRGTGSAWIDHLQRLNRAGGFERSLVLTSENDFADSLLNLNKNVWRGFIQKWRLAEFTPYGVGTKPDPSMIEKSERERQQRVDTYADSLMKAYGVSTRAEAIAQYKVEYDANTAVIENEAKTIAMPSFINNPPLGIDDNLRYDLEELPGGGPLVVSTFDNISSGTSGLAFNMNVVPESLLVYAAALPTLLTDISVQMDGRAVPYETFVEQLRKEILSLYAYFSVNYRTERSELVLRAAGSNRAESEKALDWMSRVLFNQDLSPDNLARIRDAVQQTLSGHRGRMQSSEESWVNTPANAYWRQSNPMLLSTDCFLTQAHALLRLKWQLKEAKTQAAAEEFVSFMAQLAQIGSQMKRDSLTALLGSVGSETSTHQLSSRLKALSSEGRELVDEALEDLKVTLSGVPEATFHDDWQYLCRQLVNDLRISPLDALASVQRVIDLLRHQDNVRGFMIASSADQKTLIPKLEEIVARLSSEKSTRQRYDATPRILARVAERQRNLLPPLYVGLVHNGTRSGVHINTADCAGFWDSEPEKLLTFLSARLYGGGGAHSMFMKTWGAGLAYSNGLRSNEVTGRLVYYAERCPDLSQTMDFVVNTLKDAPYDTTLADYAVSQAFAVMRSGSSYESRGEEMADDLADGLTPEVVKRFRKGILELRKEGKLYEKLHRRLESTYGRVLPGYGLPTDAAVQQYQANYFVIGPDKQLNTYEDYLQKVESPNSELVRLYPRDFWLIGHARN